MSRARNSVRRARPDPDPSWRDQAACKNPAGHANARRRTEPFYATPDHDQARRDLNPQEKAALALCAVCQSKAACLDYALSAREEYGIWGATTPQERRAIWRARQPARRRGRAS